jgi:hypothetical protein
MERFLERYGSEVKGVISGWDRIAFRGTIRWLASVRGVATYLSAHDMLLKDYGHWVSSLTDRIRGQCDGVADSLGIRREYLRSSAVDKEAWARQIAQNEGIETGPICMFSVVEPSWSPTVVGSRQSRKLEIVMRLRKCIWIYFYFNDARFGFGHLRLQTWMPFSVRGCLNGRHWLERSLIKAGIGYIKQDNCFRWIADPARAQGLMDVQLRTHWPSLLDSLVDRYFPVVRGLFPDCPMHYYWSADESEWATDVMFRNTATLDRLFPMLARHALIVSDSATVMRYLGHIAPNAALPGHVTGDIRGDRRRRFEGLCVKHHVGRNSIKAYNKAGNVLRAETTINHTRAFKVFRAANDNRRCAPTWLPMRKGVADMERRSRVSQAANERYLNAIAAASTNETFLETVKEACQRTTRNGRPVRALNPFGPYDFHLLRFLTQGQWTANGLRNRDLVHWLDPNADTLSPPERTQLSSRVSRLLGILRAHKLIRKLPRTHRYIVTHKGLRIAALIIAASTIDAQTLMEKAA